MNPEELKKQFEETESRVQALKVQYAQCTQYLGQIDAVLTSTKPYWVNLATQPPGEFVTPVLASGSAVVAELSYSIDKLTNTSIQPVSELRSISLSALSFGSNTAATSYILPQFKGPMAFDVKIVPVIDYVNKDELSTRFEKIDPSLAAVSKQIWECLYGTVSDPERSALYMMRQSWDHLFGIIAPDDKVRESQFFIPKTGDKSKMVTREERIQYAISEQVRDSSDKSRLQAATKQMLDLYQELNRAHKRGEMNAEKAVSSLHALYDWLLQWADALEKRC